MTPLVLAVTMLAVYRITLLVTADAITEPVRGKTSGWFGELIHCPWCASMWVAPLVVASALMWSTGWGWWMATAPLACSAVTGILAEHARP